jgi:hypothetical protein
MDIGRGAALYPHLTQAVRERRARFEEFLSRPNIQKRLSGGELLVKAMHIDTATESITALDSGRLQ